MNTVYMVNPLLAVDIEQQEAYEEMILADEAHARSMMFEEATISALVLQARQTAYSNRRALMFRNVWQFARQYDVTGFVPIPHNPEHKGEQ